MATYDIRSITQVGTSEPFELQVARGQIPGHSFLSRQGRVPAMSVNTIMLSTALSLFPKKQTLMSEQLCGQITPASRQRMT